jgi:hypothetical protein
MSWRSVREFLSKQRTWPWQIDLLKNVDPDKLKDAQAAVSNHEHPDSLPSLRYTEHNPAWVLLYKEIKTSQIHPSTLKRMRRIDLEYLAGMNDSPPDLSDKESAKLRENVARATHELNRRNQLWAGLIGAIVGAVIGAAAILLAG